MTGTKKAKEPQSKQAERIVKHDPDPHKGNPARTRPDLDVPSRDEGLEEVRRIRSENEARAATHDRVTVDHEVLTVSGYLRVTAADGRVYIESDEAVLDQDGAINLRHAVEAAFQAVS